MKKNLLLVFSLLAFSISYSQTIALQSFATGFTTAVDIAHPPNDTRLFVVQQGGLIRILNPNGTTNATPFLNLTSIISIGSERGLLGLAFHPNYATNGLFFVNYTNTSGNTVIARYAVSANPNVANTTGVILMTINQPYSNHNGGCLRFGPDGYLYIGMGDGGSGGDPQGYSQNLDLTNANVVANPSRIYLGKMLRIDVDVVFGLLNYGYPATNPYVNEAGKGEIWARGLRNPWRFSFNRLNGDLWIGDVGQNAVEEIDKVAAPFPNTGLNFGWKCYEGTTAYSTSGCPAVSTMTQPVAQYTHTATGGCSITGGYFYTGTMYPNFQNKYFFAEFCNSQIGFLNSSNVITWGPTNSGFMNALGEDSNGELYVAVANDYATVTPSVIYKIVDSSFSTSEFDKAGFSLFPNPAKDSFTLKSSTETLAKKVELYDVSGKLLLSQSVNELRENTISVSNLTKGMYLIDVETSNGIRYNSKLIVE
jgi:glucose/arabinose dehydrogenase